MSFWCVQFSQETNENNLTQGTIVIKSNFFVHFLGELKISKRHFKINWPLVFNKLVKKVHNRANVICERPLIRICKNLSLKNFQEFQVNFLFDLFLLTLSTNYFPLFFNMCSNVFTLYFRQDLKLHPVTRLPHLQIVRVKKLWVKVWNMSSAAVAPVVATSQRSSSVTKTTVDIFSKFLHFSFFCYLRSRFIRFR